MTGMPHLAARWVGTPIAMHPAKADIMARAFGGRVLGQPVRQVSGSEPLAGLLIEPMEQTEPDYVRPFITNSVAVIGIEGVLCAKGKWVGRNSGETSYEGIMAQAVMAHQDPMVKGVVLEVDSPGGEVSNMFACARVIRELARAKPMIAILSDMACSAAYALATAASHIIIPDTGAAGSIGVIALHASYAGMLEKQGVEITILKAGARKADMNPYESLPADVRDTYLAELELLRGKFAGMVGLHRGDRLTMEAAMATEAATYAGEAAVAAGLADAVADPHEALAAFIEEINRA
ncbi:MAG: S49 family peptidase [Hoeflea sp.]|uniref:S49 family peptidase n=1 Tax=Hoeflea sp. TaxID=1940281 RepID=UPI003EFB39BF